MTLTELIKYYYEQRKYVWPNFDDAMKFVQTEIAEVYELDLDRNGDWVRNNPQNKPKWNVEDLSTELGDVIMMLIVAGLAEGVDPIQSLINKLESKLALLNAPKDVLDSPNNIPEKTITMTTPVHFNEE